MKKSNSAFKNIKGGMNAFKVSVPREVIHPVVSQANPIEQVVQVVNSPARANVVED